MFCFVAKISKQSLNQSYKSVQRFKIFSAAVIENLRVSRNGWTGADKNNYIQGWNTLYNTRHPALINFYWNSNLLSILNFDYLVYHYTSWGKFKVIFSLLCLNINFLTPGNSSKFSFFKSNFINLHDYKQCIKSKRESWSSY